MKNLEGTEMTYEDWVLSTTTQGAATVALPSRAEQEKAATFSAARLYDVAKPVPTTFRSNARERSAPKDGMTVEWSPIQNFACSICSRTISGATNYQYHLSNHDETGVPGARQALMDFENAHLQTSFVNTGFGNSPSVLRPDTLLLGASGPRDGHSDAHTGPLTGAARYSPHEKQDVFGFYLTGKSSQQNTSEAYSWRSSPGPDTDYINQATNCSGYDEKNDVSGFYQFFGQVSLRRLIKNA